MKNQEIGILESVESKKKFIAMVKNDGDFNNPWIEDIVNDFEEITEDERFNMYLAFQEFEKVPGMENRNERNEKRFHFKDILNNRVQESIKKGILIGEKNKAKYEKRILLIKIFKYSLTISFYIGLYFIGKFLF
jgi:hypothetical protein